MSSIVCSMPRSRQYISNTQGETSQPMKYSPAAGQQRLHPGQQLLLRLDGEAVAAALFGARLPARGKWAIWLNGPP